jgi:hypothetical protein
MMIPNPYTTVNLKPFLWMDAQLLQTKLDAILKKSQNSSDFDQVQQAIILLQNPLQRLKAFLTLNDQIHWRATIIPESWMDLFSHISSFLHTNHQLIVKYESASSQLAKNILIPKFKNQIHSQQVLLSRLQTLLTQCYQTLEILQKDFELQQLNWEKLYQQYVNLSYLSKWQQELQSTLPKLLCF